MRPKVVVSQLGARMHYAVPRILQAHGQLERLYTDICGSKGWPRMFGAIPSSMRPHALRRLVGRVPYGVPPERITTFPRFGIECAVRRARARTLTERTAVEIWSGRVLSDLVARSGFGSAQAVFGYSGECLGLLEAARAAGLRTIVEQTNAPRGIVSEFFDQEQERFPEWEERVGRSASIAEYNALEAAEWNAADVVLCGSNFVRQSIARQGGPVERCVVVPYGVGPRFTLAPKKRRDGPLRVLTIGEVGLRKGSPYVMQAARLTRGIAEFRMVGLCSLSPQIQTLVSSVVDLRGAVPRSEILEHYQWADVFLLPSICEGSATVVYEALAASLPVITTPNTGTVVRHGVDGYVVPIRDAEAIAHAIHLLAHDEELRIAMAANAGAQARNYDLENYGRRLTDAISPEADYASV
ncbi:glycosyltransferase family 4 protein [Microvirga pakistanensis]|uniref:glycosyltransferase family 4 protein n=1 Tax=Microvirga pakistanensis TaxID=1682650 RepID=UPI00106B43D2|nr:glycosyltransferase family 4 protein [Microvirga pakistanensis]